MGKRAANLARRRERVIDAAATLFTVAGYAGTSIDEIGEAAGMSGPAVYRYFESKPAVLAAVLERGLDRIAKSHRVVDGIDDPHDRLVALTGGSLELAAQERELFSMYDREKSSLDAADFERLGTRLVGLEENWVREIMAVRPALTRRQARLVTRAVTGIVEAVTIRAPRMPRADMVPFVTNLIVAMIENAGGAEQ